MLHRQIIEKQSKSKGQVALITLLMMVVLLTIGLSIAQQTTLSLFDSQTEEGSTQVLNAAESGIEAALAANLQPGSASFVTSDNITVNYSVKAQEGVELVVPEGNAISLDVSGANNSNRLELNWSTEDCTNAQPENRPATLLYTIIYDEGGAKKAMHGAFAGCNDRDDGISTAGVQNGQDGYSRRASLNLSDNYEVVRIRPIYSSTKLKARGTGGGSWQLTDQSFVIESEAKSESNETRKVAVTVTADAYPSVFDYAVYSGSTIVK